MTDLQSAHSRGSGNPAPAERGRADVPTGGHPSSRERRDRTLRIALPIVVLALGLLIWEAVVRIENVPAYVLPAPGLILKTLVTDWVLLGRSLLVTLATTLELAAVGGVDLAILFNQSRLVEYSRGAIAGSSSNTQTHPRPSAPRRRSRRHVA